MTFTVESIHAICAFFALVVLFGRFFPFGLACVVATFFFNVVVRRFVSYDHLILYCVIEEHDESSNKHHPYRLNLHCFTIFYSALSLLLLILVSFCFSFNCFDFCRVHDNDFFGGGGGGGCSCSCCCRCCSCCCYGRGDEQSMEINE